MKKIYFFAAAIAAVALVSCSDDEGGVSGGDDSCTCTAIVSGVTTDPQDYDSAYMDYLNVSSCSELESYFEDELYGGAYEVTCK